MLVLGGRTFTLGGVTVFSDHADASQFWYLPAPVTLATGADGEPQLSFLKYRPAVVAAGEKGGGFLAFTVALPLAADTAQQIRAQLATLFPGVSEPRLSPAPFVDGSVRLVALDLQGADGTVVAPTAAGGFQMVEKILGSAMPSLAGDEQATFGLTLSQEGATVLERALADDTTPLGALYTLSFVGLRPPLDVRVTADLKLVYQALSLKLDVEVSWLSAGIDAAMATLVQAGAIKIEILNPTNDEENQRKEQQALALFQQQLVEDWFRPTLTPAMPPAPDATTPTTPAAPTTPALALRLRAVSEDEQKTFVAEYHESQAVRRTHTVQGLFGALARGVDRAKHFRDVDLDDPFFRVITVTLTPPRDFDGIGLSNAVVGLDYAGDHSDVAFTRDTRDRASWQAFRNPRDGSAFSYTVGYTFDPRSDWEGEKLAYDVPATRTENALVYVNPFETLGFFAIQLTPGRIEWSVIDAIEIYLARQTTAIWRPEKRILLRADSPPQTWKLRLADKHDDAFSWRLTYHLKSGGRLERPAATTNAPAILVEDPFVDKLDVVFQPVFDAAKTRSASVDTSYEDPDQGYVSEGHVDLTAGGQAAHVLIPIFDPAKRRFKYRVTLIGADGAIHTGAWVEGDETLLMVTDSGAR
ncbi:MAG TPA: hypothetical protein VFF06_09210 [Polyangia bacterium]|nr:hypothetical protein [Polyangia bacterium]